MDANPELTRPLARRIVEIVGAHGAPPEWGFQAFSAGIDTYLDVLERDYFDDYVAEGGSAFKLVIGAYGGGKTHFLYSCRELGWKHGFAVSYVGLSPEESPFHRLEKVYGAIVKGLMPPLGPEEVLEGTEKGIDAFIRRWYRELDTRFRKEGISGTELVDAIGAEARRSVDGVESISFAFAIRHAMEALATDRHEDFLNIMQWLKAEGHDRSIHRQYSLLHPVDRSQAFTLIRSVARWVRALGHRGLVILFDEAEQLPSLSSKQRELMLSNLREIIDECGQSSFKNVMIFYAVPDEAFFEGRSNVYEALKQRIATVFEVLNPTGVKIDLERVMTEPEALLAAIGERLAKVFETAYRVELPGESVTSAVKAIARAAYDLRFGDIGYKRLFVQGVIRGFQALRHDPSIRTDDDWALDIVQGSGG